MGHARALLPLEKADAIRRAAQQVVREELSVRATEALVRRALHPPVMPLKRDALSGSANLKALVSRLERRLGTRCRVIQKTQQAGKLEIDYGSLAELDGVLDKIGA
jgi:ParB family chromosome partitioning protein